MKPKILLVEDDLDFGTILKQYLELSDFEVTWFADPLEVKNEIIKANTFQVGILDVMMPNIDGFTLAKNIRKINSNFPLLFLTAKNQRIDRITGLKLGADDYVTKPCDPEELVLRLHNILKRTKFLPSGDIIKIGNYELLPEKLTLKNGTTEERLTIKEKELLLYLLRHNKQTVTRESILTEVWENSDYFTGRSMDVFISRLRKYLSKDATLKIESVRGVGFWVDFGEV